MAKTCRKCGGTKRAWCIRNRERHRAYRRAKYAANSEPGKIASTRRQIRLRYGLTKADVEAMLVAQAGRCWLCDGPLGHKNEPVIDHDHATGAVRGLAHLKCNTILGMAGEDDDLLHTLSRRARDLKMKRLRVIG